MTKPISLRCKRKNRIRSKIRLVSGHRLRLSVFKSGVHIYAQVIDDKIGHTIAQASTMDKEFKEKSISGSNIAAAEQIGQILARRAQKAGVNEVVFDRSGYLYHGRVKALAQSAREHGLVF